MECVSQGHQIVALVNMQPPQSENDSIEIDSYMYQSVGTEGVKYLAEALNLPLYQAEIRRSAQCTSMNYEISVEDEVEDLYDLLCIVRKEHPEVNAILSGAILSNYQRERVENICYRLSWHSLAFLWRRNQRELLLDMIASDVLARIVKIASYGLDVKRDLGSWISDFMPRAFKLAADPECSLNPCGEGGEFETFTFDCPIFHKRIVATEPPKVIVHSSDLFSTVAYLHYHGLRLEEKSDVLKSKDLLSIEKSILVDGNNEIRHPFITNEKRCENLLGSVTEEISGDILGASIVESKMSASSEFPVTFVLISNSFGKNYESVAETILHAFSDMKTTISNKSFNRVTASVDDVLHCIVATNLKISDNGIRKTVDYGFRNLFETRLNSSPSFLCVSSPLNQGILQQFGGVSANAEVAKANRIVVSIACILASPEGKSTMNVETMRVRSLSHWAPAIPLTQFHSQAVKYASQDCFFSGVIGVMPETGELPSISEVVSDGLPLHIEQQCWLALRHVHRLIMAMEQCGWQYLAYAVVYATSIETLHRSKEQFHTTVCEALSKWREAERCLCQARIVWVVTTNLPNGAAVQWQFATSRSICSQGDCRAVMFGKKASAKLDEGSNFLFLVKADVFPPLETQGMVIPVVRFLEEEMKIACVNLSTTHISPSTKSINPLPPSKNTDISTRAANDEFNSPDPSQYCQNLRVEDTVKILRDWLATLDVDQHYPSLPVANNLAALVSHNDCLQKLVSLGADLSKMESQPGVANLLVKTDFETAISPKLWLLTDFGFKLPQISRVMTCIPKTVVKSSTEELASKLKYFTDRRFTSDVVVRMISDQPTILEMSSCEVDKVLASIQTTFSLKADQVRHIAGGAPKCVVQPIKTTKDVFVVLTKMLGFPVAQTREMLIDFPRNRVLSTNTFHLHKRLELPFELIALFPRSLCAPPRLLMERTNFLKLCNRFQPYGSKPLFTSLDAIVEGTDEEFFIPKIRTSLKYNDNVKSEKFITPFRVSHEYMLTNEDTKTLTRYYSRSPYTWEVRTQVFDRNEVEQMALMKYGGQEGLAAFRRKVKEAESQRVSLIDRLTRRKKANNDAIATEFADLSAGHNRNMMPFSWNRGAGRVVMAAIIVNILNVGAKAWAWWITGSKSMFSEMMHSVADTLNQVILAYGIHSSLQRPDTDHPYGYSRMRSISSLISGVGIFFLGAGFTCYHALQGMVMPIEDEHLSIYCALGVAVGSLLTEGTTLAMAYREVSTKSRENGFPSIRSYLLSGTAEPSTAVVLLEDSAAVLGVIIAGGGLAGSYMLHHHMPDTAGGLLISILLGGVAAFIIRTNTDILLGKSVSGEKMVRIMQHIDRHKIVRGTYDTKAVLMGGGNAIRLKSEIDIDGRELTRRYLETVPLGSLLTDIKSIETEDDMIAFMLYHGDHLVNTLGAEINQIEESIKREFPDIKHIDIEIN
nr:zinc transporter 9 [Hymenolepis microstoma]